MHKCRRIQKCRRIINIFDEFAILMTYEDKPRGRLLDISISYIIWCLFRKKIISYVLLKYTLIKSFRFPLNEVRSFRTSKKGKNIEKKVGNNYFLHWNFDKKSYFVVFFHEWNEWKNPQFNFSSQNLSIECNFFRWGVKESNQDITPTFP